MRLPIVLTLVWMAVSWLIGAPLAEKLGLPGAFRTPTGIAAESGYSTGFPYAARVKGLRASVRSGPGRQHYVCETLPGGASVEVFRKEGEWLAIKPTEGCFCWVAARHVRRTEEEGLGEIIDPQTIAWIGTERSHPGDFVWQVQLDPGETVEILDEEAFSPLRDAPKKPHYRIAPPAGEFRWVRSNELEADPDWNLVEQEDAPDLDESARVAQLHVRSATPADESAPNTDASQAASQAAHFVTPKKDSQTKGTQTKGNEARGFVSRGSENSADARSRWRSSAVSRKSFDDATLETLSLELSGMVADDPRNWDLAPIRNAAERLVTTSPSNLERAKAKRLVERVREFEAIHQGHLRLEETAERLNSTRSKLASSASERTAPTRDASPRSDLKEAGSSLSAPILAKSDADTDKDPHDDPFEDSRYDGIGRLAPVYSKTQAAPSSSLSNLWGLLGGGIGPQEQKTAPPFALLDKDNNIVQFVAPSPGLNLHRYQEKRVGIIGNGRYDSSLKKPLLTAERVIELDRHRR